ncbi:MAG: sugar phosphate isomerase/epimerase, partial [Candidatus Marinimicrobia bacterium]|nr:sugar phosphate isomerase/epimerase [Candidatus Neomarinimicrobiota bacterium]
SAEATPADRRRITDALRTACAAAADHHLLVATEFHGHTLTDTAASTLQLLTETAHPALRTFWQPPVGATPDAARTGLQAVLPFVHNCHVFHWSGPDRERRPLAEGAAAWTTYCNLIAQTPGPHHACLEFLRDNDPAHLPAEAATLRQLIQQATL